MDEENKVNKKYRQVYLSDEDVEYIENFGRENHIRKSAAMSVIINEHRNKEPINPSLIAKAIREELSPELTRIRLASNTADRNSQVIIEILNTIILNLEIITPTLTNELESPTVSAAKEKIKADIERYKQIKDDKKIKGKNDKEKK